MQVYLLYIFIINLFWSLYMQKNRIYRVSLFILVIIVFIQVNSCSLFDGGSGGGDEDSDDGGASSGEADSIRELIQSIPHLDWPQPTNGEVNVGSEEEVESGDENYTCTKQRKEYGKQTNQPTLIDTQPDIIWPGALIKGRSLLETGGFSPITGDRNPVTIFVSLEVPGFQDRTVTVENPAGSSITEAMAEILASYAGDSPTTANISYDEECVHSYEQLSLAIDANVEWPGGSRISSKFDFTDETVKSRMAVRFYQVYYSISVDTPSSPEGVFSNTVTVSDLETQMGAGNPPLYVSRVVFGRMVLFLFESEHNAQEVGASFEAAYSGCVEAEGSVDTRQKSILDSSKINAVVYGGSGTDAAEVVINGYEGLKTYIENGAEFGPDSPGAPIAFELRYLADNDSCNIVFYSQYDTYEYQRISDIYKVTLKNIHCNADDEAGSHAEIYGWLGTCIAGDISSQIVLWEKDEDGAVEIEEGSDYQINSYGFLEFPSGADYDAAITLRGHLYEDDTTGDDDLGFNYINVLLSDDLSAEKSVVFYEEGGGSTKVTANYVIEPVN